MPQHPIQEPTPTDPTSQPGQEADDPGRDYIKREIGNLPPFGPATYLPPERVTYTQGYTVERYVRVNVVKNSKGYNTDVSTSITTTAPHEVIERELKALLVMAADVMDQEIQRQRLESLESYEDRGS